LPNRSKDGISRFPDMLFVSRLANRVISNDIIFFPDRLAYRIAAFSKMALVDRLADSVTALLHDRVVHGPVADTGLFLDDGLITDLIAHPGHATLILGITCRGVRTSATVPSPQFIGDDRLPKERRSHQQCEFELHLRLLRVNDQPEEMCPMGKVWQKKL